MKTYKFAASVPGLYMIKSLKAVFFAFLLVGCATAFAQVPGDISSMSSQERQKLLQQARAMGYSDEDLLNMARSQGYLPTPTAPVQEEEKKDKQKVKSPIPLDIYHNGFDSSRFFGYNLFNPSTRNLSFETNLLIPVPEDYVIGPSDQLTIDIYGASEKSMTMSVDLNGNLRLPNIGPVSLSGLTLKQAERRVKSRLSTIYRDLSSGNPSTFLDLSVTKVRTIKVNLVGELRMPGTYSVNGLSTVFNAIYVAGGPNELGTLRDIRIYRKSKLIASLDFYDFLVKGETRNNVRLQNDDVIMVGPYLNRVELKGEIKRPGIYELKDEETFRDLLNYAGGFTEFAFKDKINVVRVSKGEKVISNLFSNQFEIFEAKAGDSYRVGKILDRYVNRVQIRGAVFRPGAFAYSEGMLVGDLIELADGLKGDAYLDRALLVRNTKTLGTSTTSFDLRSLGQDGLSLQPEDVVIILSIYDTVEEQYIRISGEVNAPGVYRYSDNMTLDDMLILANGTRQSAQLDKIEISRRPENQSADNQSEIILASVNQSDPVVLKPFDHVVVRRNPNFFEERTVTITGQVMYPGSYTLQKENERISSLVSRAGSLRSQAYPEGATLIRKTEFFTSEQTIETLEKDLMSVISNLDTATISESDKVFISEVIDELESLQDLQFSNSNMATKAKKERLSELAAKNPFLSDIKIKESESIALDFSQILSQPNSPEDLILEHGDIINIPKQLTTVRVRGRVLFPNTVRFEPDRSLKYFIGKAGGFDTRAKKNSAYVVYANGEVAKTRSFLFLRSYPKVAPGAEVIVPVKPIRIPLAPSDLIGLTTGLGTLALIVTQIYNTAQGN